jgi:hypothetical protein
MILCSPAIDLALPLAFVALAFVAALDLGLAGWLNGMALCVVGLLGGLLWLQEAVTLALHRPEGQDG